jgi:uncharacterized cupredoxin-like copper-binding protein
MVSRFRGATFLGMLIPVFLLTLAACGSTSLNDKSGMPGMSHGGQHSGAMNGAPAGSVTVSLSDFKIEASQTSFQVGKSYHFVVTNLRKSTANHELMLMMPMSGDGMDMSEMDKMALYSISQQDLPPGASKSFDFTFSTPAAAGELEFACHVGSHYSLGMHAPIIVTQ